MRNVSEVAQLLAQIETEYLAATRGLSGFAESARHAAITARMENLGRLHSRLLWETTRHGFWQNA